MPTAADNTVFLLSNLMAQECSQNKGNMAKFQALAYAFARIFLNEIDKSLGLNILNDNITLLAGNFSIEEAAVDKYSSNCTIEFSRMLSRHLTHLAHIGDPHAFQSLAEMYASGRPPFKKNITRAAQFYAMAAELADIQSYIALGWLFANGSPGELERNTTVAKRLFATAKSIEQLLYQYALEESWSNDEGYLDGVSILSTGGLAPQIAESILYFQNWWEFVEKTISENSQLKPLVLNTKCFFLIEQVESCVHDGTDYNHVENSVFWAALTIFLLATFLRVLVVIFF